MSLYKCSLSPEVLDAYKNGVKLFTDSDDALQSVLLDAHAADQSAHEVFSLGLRHIGESDKGIENARSIGWRLMASNETLDLAGACHITQSDDEGPKVIGLSRGPELKTIFKRIDQFDSLPEVQQKRQASEEYDLQVLRIPGLVEAFWIRSRRNSPYDDLVVPFFTRVRSLDPSRSTMRAMPMEEFFRLVLPFVKKRLGYSDEHGS